MDTKKLKNNKYYIGKYNKFEKYKGWFIGSFFNDDDPRKTDKVEVQYKEQKKGHVCKSHYHKKKIELLIMIKGGAIFTINGNRQKIKTGDFLFIDINNITSGEFTKDSKYFSIHAPSITDDKVLID
jgi:quercetin dioxygenase-like cupin family protein